MTKKAVKQTIDDKDRPGEARGPQILTTEADRVFRETLERLYPKFRDYVIRVKGYHCCGDLSFIVLWYEFLDYAKEDEDSDRARTTTERP